MITGTLRFLFGGLFFLMLEDNTINITVDFLFFDTSSHSLGSIIGRRVGKSYNVIFLRKRGNASL